MSESIPGGNSFAILPDAAIAKLDEAKRAIEDNNLEAGEPVATTSTPEEKPETLKNPIKSVVPPTPEQPVEELKENINEKNGTEPVVPKVEYTKGDKLEGRDLLAISGTVEYLGGNNTRFFEGMTTKGKGLANSLYEGLYKIPGVNRIVGKLEIAYNQNLADRHELKAAQLKGEMDALDLKTSAFNDVQAQISSIVTEMKEAGSPGSEILQIKSRNLDRKKTVILNEKDAVQTKFEARMDRVSLYTNQRDRIADKLISRYNTELLPLEGKLIKLRTNKSQIDQLVSDGEKKNVLQLAALDEQERKLGLLEKGLKLAGESDIAIRSDEALQMIRSQIQTGREKIQLEKEDLVEKRAQVDREIAKTDAKANPYRDKKAEFSRIKDSRPIDMGVPVRKAVKDHSEPEDISPRFRVEENEPSSETQNESIKTLQYFFNSWNDYLKKNPSLKDKILDQKKFLAQTKIKIGEQTSWDNFGDMLVNYYGLGGIFNKTKKRNFLSDFENYKKQALSVKK